MVVYKTVLAMASKHACWAETALVPHGWSGKLSGRSAMVSSFDAQHL